MLLSQSYSILEKSHSHKSAQRVSAKSSYLVYFIPLLPAAGCESPLLQEVIIEGSGMRIASAKLCIRRCELSYVFD